MRHYLSSLLVLAACTDAPADDPNTTDFTSQLATHAPATPPDLTAQPASDGTASANVATWPTGSTYHAVISENPPANPPDSSLVKTTIGSGSGWFTVGLGLAAGYEVGQVRVSFQHSLGNGATSGDVRVALVYAGNEIASASVPSTTTWTTSTLTFARRTMTADVRDATQLQLRFYLDNTTAGNAGNVRLAWASSDVWKLKAVISGAMTVGYSMPGNSVPAAVSYVALNVDWSQLEPDSAGDQHYTGANWTGPGWATIDNAIAQIDSNPNLKGLRLRVMAGAGAPNFVKGLCTRQVGCTQGVLVNDPHHDIQHCIPCFWQANYQAQYEELMREIARRYDGRDEIREVVDSGCMTVFAEPFVRSHTDKPSNDNVLTAGYTYAGDVACHQAALDVAQDDFIRTRTSIALNPWDEPCLGCNTDDAKHSFPDTAAFISTNAHAKPSLGRKLVLQANHVNWQYGCTGGSPTANDACYLAADSGPKGFQCTDLNELCSYNDSRCITYAITINGVLQGLEASLRQADNPEGGWFLEIQNGFNWSTVNVSDFNLRDANLQANVN